MHWPSASSILLSLGGRWLGWEVRIDDFLFTIFASYADAAGRMPSLSALMFLMLGLALLLLDTEIRQFLAVPVALAHSHPDIRASAGGFCLCHRIDFFKWLPG